MSRRVHLGFLLLGLAAFAVMVWRAGPARLVAEVGAAGWALVPIVLVYALVYLASAEAWRLTMGDEARRISRRRGFAITAWAFALNYVTPIVSVGGEPFKIAAAAQWLGTRRAAASVLGERLLHLEAHLLFLLGGVVAAYVLLPRATVGAAALLGLGLLILVVVAAVIALHRTGGLEWLVRLLTHLPLGRRIAAWVGSKRAIASGIDAEIAAFARERPGRYALALAMEIAGRLLSVVELVLIARAVGVPIDYQTGFLITAFLSLAVNVFFFIPFSLGAREAGLYLVFGALGMPPDLGVAASVLGRLRELSWIAIGLALGFATRRSIPDGSGAAAGGSAAHRENG